MKQQKINGHTLPQFIAFLNETLIPDLKESGTKETAKDFESAVKWIELQGQQRNELLDALEGMAALYEVMHNRHPFIDDRPNIALRAIAKAKSGTLGAQKENLEALAMLKKLRDAVINTPALDSSSDWTELVAEADRVLGARLVAVAPVKPVPDALDIAEDINRAEAKLRAMKPRP